MPARKKIPGKKQIIRTIQSLARKLGRAPIQAEFVRMSGIEVRVIKRHFRRFPAAVRAAGLTGQSGQRVETAEMLKDWGEVVRRMGRAPGYNDYIREGRFGRRCSSGDFNGGRWCRRLLCGSPRQAD